MMGRTHLAIGLLVALLLLPVIPGSRLLFVLLVLLGALLPDVDHEGSIINKRVPLTRWIPLFFRHRGFFHSVFPPIIMAVLALYLDVPALGLYLGVGILSHLVSDALTDSGVNFIYPVSRWKVRGIMSTGGVMELAVFVVVVVLDVVLAFHRVTMFI